MTPSSPARRPAGRQPRRAGLRRGWGYGRSGLWLPLALALVGSGRAEAKWPWSKKPKTEAATAAPAPAKKTKPAEASEAESAAEPQIDLVDAPTADILDYGGFSSRTRFFSNGGALTWGSFGVFQRLNIGASLNVDKLLGTQSPVQVTHPELQVKLRFYDGDRSIPAFSVGYDGQGCLYNRPNLLYNQRQRGLYVVGSQEVFAPGLQAHAGANISDFNSSSIFGFAAASYDIQEKVLVMAEWDNIHNYVDSRFNAGLRVFLTPSFNADFAVRSIGQGGAFSNGVSRGAERIIEFRYTGNF